MKKKSRLLIAAFLATSFVFWGGPLLNAQEDEPEGFMLEEITVTAQKRVENQQKVAIAMDVITSENLKTTGRTDIDDILSSVSNILVQKSQDGLRVSLRGYGDQTPAGHMQSTSTPGVAVNVDGVYSNRKDTGYAMFDMERVEVLFGPQSTLYASNSPGGIVNIETANPKLDKYEASGTLEYGSYELLHTEGMVNVPMGDIMALRAAFQTKSHDGYYANGGDDEDIKSGRLKFLVQPKDNFSASVTGEVIKSVTHTSGSFIDTMGGTWVYEDEVDDPWDNSGVTLKDPDTNTSKKINAKVNWDLRFASLTATANYAKHNGYRNELMNDPMTGVTLNTKYDTSGEETGVELLLNSSADSYLKWIFGLNYYDAEDWQDGLAYDNSTGELIVIPADQIVYQNYPDLTPVDTPNYRYTGSVETAKAAFFNVTYPVTDSLRVKAGIRYSKDDFTFHNNEIRGAGPNMFEDTRGATTGVPYDDTDYSLGLEYDLGEDSMLYGTFATSYKVAGLGGGRPGHPGNEVLPPETLNAYTLGSKNRFLGNTLQLNAAAFYYDYENFNASDMAMAYVGPYPPTEADLNAPGAATPDPGGSQFGAGMWYGLDVQSTYLITSNDTVNLNLSYLHSEWTDLIFDYEYDYLLTNPFMTQATLDDLVEAVSKDMNGEPMTLSPEWTVTLSYTHKFNLPNGGSIDGRLDSKYQSDYELSWKHEKDYPYNYQEAFINGDVTITYASPDGQWTLSGYCKNVRDYAEKRSYFGEPGNQMRIGTPRTFGAVLSARF